MCFFSKDLGYDHSKALGLRRSVMKSVQKCGHAFQSFISRPMATIIKTRLSSNPLLSEFQNSQLMLI